jgi:predicted extracellular nuclease
VILAGQTGAAAQGSRAHTAPIVSPDIVISQVYGGGGNAGAFWRQDFIELFNRGAAPVNVAGWSVQYTSSAGSSWTNRTNITAGVVNPGQYFLIQEAAGNGGTQDLPTPDVVGTIAMGGTAGKVALVTNQVNLACGTNCDTDPSVRDFVGYGGANDFEGAGPTAVLSNTTAALRTLAGCTDANTHSTLSHSPRQVSVCAAQDVPGVCPFFPLWEKRD